MFTFEYPCTFSAQLIAVGKTFCNFEDVYGNAYLQQQSLLVRFYSGASNGFIISELASKDKDFRLRPIQRATDGAKCTMTKGKVNIACNTVGRLTLTGETFKPDVLPEGTLAGEFSVSNDGGTTIEQVHFSKGNLYYDGSKFKFEANQYSGTSYANNHVSHFYWSKDASVAYAVNYSDSGDASDVFFNHCRKCIKFK